MARRSNKLTQEEKDQLYFRKEKARYERLAGRPDAPPAEKEYFKNILTRVSARVYDIPPRKERRRYDEG